VEKGQRNSSKQEMTIKETKKRGGRDRKYQITGCRNGVLNAGLKLGGGRKRN